jgi:hypothetical protein
VNIPKACKLHFSDFAVLGDIARIVGQRVFEGYLDHVQGNGMRYKQNAAAFEGFQYWKNGSRRLAII